MQSDSETITNVTERKTSIFNISRITAFAGCVVVVLAILFLILVWPTENPVQQNAPGDASDSRVLLSMTTFLSKDAKVDALTQAVRSLCSIHSHDELMLIDKFIILNEYEIDDTKRQNCNQVIDRLRSEFLSLGTPFEIEIIQKTSDQRGQARSLNMIIDLLQSADYEFWIHLEDSWIYHRPWIAEGLDIMQTTNITQLQITPDWENADWWNVARTIHRLTGSTTNGSKYHIIVPSKALVTGDNNWTVPYWAGILAWPLYSLRPSINRVSVTKTIGHFSEDPELWPARFEWEYAKRWFDSGSVKGVLEPPSAQRIDGHQSTYSIPALVKSLFV
jgi:hypothetical protein